MYGAYARHEMEIDSRKVQTSGAGQRQAQQIRRSCQAKWIFIRSEQSARQHHFTRLANTDIRIGMIRMSLANDNFVSSKSILVAKLCVTLENI